jgi:2-dehydropantoate 2-reductase
MTKESCTKLRFLCFGVGAIGTYIGGSLVLSGQEVVFLDRPEVAEKVRRTGLRLTIKEKDHSILEPDVVSSLDEALTHGPFDVAILAVKSYDTLALAESLKPYGVALPPFLCLQNGVENESVLAGVLGDDKIIAGTITSAVGRRAPGEIVLERLRGLGIASDHPFSPALANVMDAAELGVRLYANRDSLKWSKMLTNLLSNASSAILDMDAAEVFSHHGLFTLEMEQIREVLQVMKALDIPVTDLPGTPVRALAWAIRRLPLFLSQPLLMRAVAKGRGGKMPSFHIDLHSGRGHSEVDYLNGAVVRFGKLAGVDTPINAFLNRTLLDLTSGKLGLSTYIHQPDKFLQAAAENQA